MKTPTVDDKDLAEKCLAIIEQRVYGALQSGLKVSVSYTRLPENKVFTFDKHPKPQPFDEVFTITIHDNYDTEI